MRNQSYIRPDSDGPFEGAGGQKLYNRTRVTRCPICDQQAGKRIEASARASTEFEFFQCAECGYGWKVERPARQAF